MDTAIRVENLTKQYRLGIRPSYRRFTERMADLARAPIDLLRANRKGNADGEDESMFWALNGVSFEVNRGDVVGIIGRNGAGKSTLLKILSGITEPTGGDVWLHGRVGSLLEVGTGFHPELTGRENIYLNGAILGMKRSEIQRKFDQIVEFSEIERFLDTPVKRYSSGMYMRLAFSVAAHLEPDILIVDEVLAVGDGEFQNKCLNKVKDISRSNRTVLFVSHNLLAVKMLCTKAILLEKGQLKAYLPANEAVAMYQNNIRDPSAGEVRWDDPKQAPGNHQARLHAVRVVSSGVTTCNPAVDQPIQIEIDYWNLEPDSRRLVSIHLINSMQVTVLTSANFKSASVVPDPWVDRRYPVGLFRTVCEVPACLLNPGRFTINLYINGMGATDNVIKKVGVIEFEVEDAQRFRTDFLGEWVGVVRPLLNWQTTQLSEQPARR